MEGFEINPSKWLHVKIGYYIDNGESKSYDRLVSIHRYYHSTLAGLIAKELDVNEDTIKVYSSNVSGVEYMYPSISVTIFEGCCQYCTGLDFVDKGDEYAGTTVFEVKSHSTYNDAFEAGYESLKKLMEIIKEEEEKVF